MSITASAEFSFAEVNKVAEVGNGFFAYTEGGEAVDISALQYTQMAEYDGYFIVNMDGKKVVAAGDEFIVEKLAVDSVGLEEGKPKVFFTNGTAKVFTKTDWLKAPKGQVVRHAYVDTPTWEFENYATVVEGDVVVYHDKIAPTKKATTTAPAPATVVVTTTIVTDGGVATEATTTTETATVETAPVVETKAEPKAEAEPKAKAEEEVQSTKNGKISFRITH